MRRFLATLALLCSGLATCAWADGPYPAPAKPKAAATPSPSPTPPPSPCLDPPGNECGDRFDLDGVPCWHCAHYDVAAPQMACCTYWVGWTPLPPARPVEAPRALVEPSPAPIPSSTPKPKAPDPNASALVISASIGGVVTMTGDATGITPAGWIDVDGPIAVGEKLSLGRVYVGLGLSSEPGDAAFNFADLTTYKAAEVRMGLGRIIGRLNVGGDQITTAIVGEGSFASRLNAGQAQRLVRAGGGGLRLASRKSTAELVVLGGFDEATGWGWCFLSRGQAPIAGTAGIIVIRGSVSLSLTSNVAWSPRRDVMKLAVVLDPGAAVRAISGKGKPR